MSNAAITGKRFLVMRLGAIGDVLRVLPAVRRLRSSCPDATIGWAVEHWAYPMIAANPMIDRFHVLDRRALDAGGLRAVAEVRRLVGEIRACRYDVLLDFHGRAKSGLIGWLTRIPVRIGYARGDASELNHLFTNVHVRLQDRWENRVLRFLDLLAPLGIDTRYDPNEHGLYIDPEIRRAAHSWYEAHDRPELAVYPGTSAQRARERWPAEKWIELLRRMADREVRSVVFWGPEEQELAQRIVAEAGASCLLAPPTTLPEMMAMIGCFRAFVGCDTAAAHMAWMQGIPTGVFIGAKPPRTIAPLEPVPSYVLRADEYYREGVRLGRQPAELVTAVPVAEALEAVGRLLAVGRRSGGGSQAGEWEGRS
ncbi:MAG: lipopolysaccharide heptosyltransferase family protein [Deltaproteobacteria bacterium]|nr:MAG: lipopolysaccharide heptosyltransferase family protein [Deltaproteobacteria bacterium]